MTFTDVLLAAAMLFTCSIEIDAHPKRRFDAGLFVGDFTRGLAHREAFQRNFSQVDRRKNRRHLR
jgi:hypothetical protein